MFYGRLWLQYVLFFCGVLLSDVFVNEELQTTFETVAHGLELPFSVALVKSSEFHRCLYREILVKVIFCYFLVSDGIIYTDIGIVHLSEVLATLFGLVDGDCKDNLLYAGVYL